MKPRKGAPSWARIAAALNARNREWAGILGIPVDEVKVYTGDACRHLFDHGMVKLRKELVKQVEEIDV